MTTDEYQKKIRRSLKDNNSYTPEMEMAITMCAISLMAMDKAKEDIENLTECYVEEVSREGNVRLVAHPSFKVLKDSSESVRRSLRELGLTMGTLVGASDDDVSDLVNEVNKVKQNGAK